MLSLGYNQLSLGNVFLQKCTGCTVIFTETKAWPWHRWEKNSETLWVVFLIKKHFNKVNLKEISEPQTLIIQHNLAYILFGLFWLWCLVKWILLYDVVCCPTFSKKFSFNAGATRVDFNIHPQGKSIIIIMNSWIHKFYPIPWGNQVAKHNKQHVQFFSYPPTLPPSGFLLVDS